MRASLAIVLLLALSACAGLGLPGSLEEMERAPHTVGEEG